jgi:tetratricopeptide (TPR) repeat protein
MNPVQRTIDHQVQPPGFRCFQCGYAANGQRVACRVCGTDTLLHPNTEAPSLPYIKQTGIGAPVRQAAVVATAVLLVGFSLAAFSGLRAEQETRAAVSVAATAVALQAQRTRAREAFDNARSLLDGGQVEAAMSQVETALRDDASLVGATELREVIVARATATRVAEATRAAVAADATRTVQATQTTQQAAADAAVRSAQANELVSAAERQRVEGNYAAALSTVEQALGLNPNAAEAVSLRDEVRPVVIATASAISATATAQAVAVSATATAHAVTAAKEKKWNDFLVYGAELSRLLRRSDEVNRNHAAAAALVSAGNLAQFYTLTDRSAESTGNLKTAALMVSAPTEGRELKDSVYQALRVREDAFNRLKEALDAPGRVSAQAASQTRCGCQRTVGRGEALRVVRDDGCQS